MMTDTDTSPIVRIAARIMMYAVAGLCLIYIFN
jgi:hypothetical protein